VRYSIILQKKICSKINDLFLQMLQQFWPFLLFLAISQKKCKTWLA